jgi:uncharacterized integral membrane protein
MFALLFVMATPVNTSVLRQSLETLDWLWPALPFLTFLLGLALGASLMYVPMTLRLWKLRQRLAKEDSAVLAPEP